MVLKRRFFPEIITFANFFQESRKGKWAPWFLKVLKQTRQVGNSFEIESWWYVEMYSKLYLDLCTGLHMNICGAPACLSVCLFMRVFLCLYMVVKRYVLFSLLLETLISLQWKSSLCKRPEKSLLCNICINVCLPVSLSVSLSVCLSIYLFVCLCMYLCIEMFTLPFFAWNFEDYD